MMMIPVKRIGILAALILASSFLFGCVTTTTGGFTEKASPEKALQKRVQLARDYIGERNWDDAKRNLQIAQDIDPSSADVHEAFALVYQSTGEYELAEESFKNSIRLDRGCSRCRNNYAAFLYSQEKYEAAVSQLETVVKDTLYTGRTGAFLNLGLSRQKVGQSEGAQEAFERALAMDRTNRIALFELATLRYEADDVDSAARYYDTYKRVSHQQSARALWLGIRITRKTGDRDAEASYGLALSNRFPKSPEYKTYKNEQLNN